MRDLDYGAMARESFAAEWTRQHEKRPYHDGTFSDWSKTRDPGHPFHFQAGVNIRAVTEDPGDDFLHPKGGDSLGDEA